MAFHLSTVPIFLLFLLVILTPHQTAPSAAIVIAAAEHDDADEIPIDDIDGEADDDDIQIGGDDDEEDDEMPEDDDEEEDEEPPAMDEPATDPNKPAVIDPEGKAGAHGYSVPDIGETIFFDGFQDGLGQWTHTMNTDYMGKFLIGQGANPTFEGDRALIIPEKAKKYGLSADFTGLEDIGMTDKDFVAQYELKLDEGMTCGGAYFKFVTDGYTTSRFDGDTKYSIMFGPDKCGGTDKVHFIFQSINPVTGKSMEHHLKKPPPVANTYDRKTHLYTLSVKSDGSFKLLVDNEVKKEGTLLDSFAPPLQPAKEVDDEDDKKPEDWVDDKKIPDPEAKKPEDWDEDAPKEIVDEDATMPEGWLEDEPEKIPDPEKKKPEEWDDESDGEWEPPLVANPKCEVGCGKWEPPVKTNPDYKGPWKAPMIDNPNYVGAWKPRKIPNKDYYEVKAPKLLPIRGVGLEIWTMDQGVLFDNLWIGQDLDQARKFAEATFVKKQKLELAREEAENKKKEDEKKKKDDAVKDKRPGKLGAVMDKVEDVIDTMETVLEPLEKWLVAQGAEPTLNKMLDLGVQKPMIVVVSVPIIIVLFLLTILGGRSRKAPQPDDEAAKKKKTDEVTADDESEKPEESSQNADASTTANGTTSTEVSAGADGEGKKTTVRKRRAAE